MSGLDIRIEDDGSIEATIARLGAMPKQIDKARRRALSKLLIWVKRQVLRAVAQATGVPQKIYKALLRYSVRRNQGGGFDIWIGTNPIAAHKLGTVRWTRRMKGARVGRRLFPGSWSWGPGSKTGTAVFERVGSERLPIERVEVEIHDAAAAAVEALQGAINERFLRLMQQELRYAVEHEGRR